MGLPFAVVLRDAVFLDGTRFIPITEAVVFPIGRSGDGAVRAGRQAILELSRRNLSF
jgi:hypothetical protein